jgi:hypothetical protein
MINLASQKKQKTAFLKERFFAFYIPMNILFDAICMYPVCIKNKSGDYLFIIA